MLAPDPECPLHFPRPTRPGLEVTEPPGVTEPGQRQDSRLHPIGPWEPAANSEHNFFFKAQNNFIILLKVKSDTDPKVDKVVIDLLT